MALESVEQSGGENFKAKPGVESPKLETSGAVALRSVEWMAGAGKIGKKQLAEMRQKIRGMGIPGERYGKFVSEVLKTRTLSESDRAIGRNVGEPMFTPGEFVQKGELLFEVVDPKPDDGGYITVQEAKWDSAGLKWTKKSVLESDILPDDAKPN